MRVLPRSRRPNPRSFYRVVGGRDTFTIELTDGFWQDGLSLDGETALDRNIDALCEELRYALYYVATVDCIKH